MIVNSSLKSVSESKNVWYKYLVNEILKYELPVEIS